MVIFAENKGFWDVVGEQGAAVVALLLAFGMVLYFLWKLTTRYGDPLIRHLNGVGTQMDQLVQSNSCLPKLSAKLEKVCDKIADWPTDFPDKLESAKCIAETTGCKFSREDAVAFLLAKEKEKAKLPTQ